MISDTDVVSNKTFDKPIPEVTRFLDWLGDRLLITFPTAVELRYGIARIRMTNLDKAIELERWADDLIARSDKLLMSPKISKVYGEMLGCNKLNNLWMHNGKPERPKLKLDLFIAAIAKCYNMPIATRNTKDFIEISRHFELPGIYNPATGFWMSNLNLLPPPTFTD